MYCDNLDLPTTNGLVIIDREAGEIICLVASVCVSVRLSVGAHLFEPFDL